jgi:hypothetical protein
MPTIATTIMSSISVNPRCMSRAFMLRSLLPARRAGVRFLARLRPISSGAVVSRRQS